MPVRFGTPVLTVEHPSSLDADLDEFYLFRGVLPAEQIKELMDGQILAIRSRQARKIVSLLRQKPLTKSWLYS